MKVYTVVNTIYTVYLLFFTLNLLQTNTLILSFVYRIYPVLFLEMNFIFMNSTSMHLWYILMMYQVHQTSNV